MRFGIQFLLAHTCQIHTCFFTGDKGSVYFQTGHHPPENFCAKGRIRWMKSVTSRNNSGYCRKIM